MKNPEARKIENFLELSSKYFDLVFPLDRRESLLSENMIPLRESEVSKRLFEELLSRNLSSRGDLTQGQIGRSVMIMLGTGKLNDRIVQRFSNDISWKAFVENFREIMESESAHPSRRFQESLSWELCKALEGTYDVHWRARDYISPSCFFYLLERLMILAPHSRSYFFTSKSMLLEHLMCLSPDANPIAFLVTDTKSHPVIIVNFVMRVIEQSLYQNFLTEKWIRSSPIDCGYYFPVLVLSLIMMLCLSCLNWDLPFDTLFKTMALPHVRSQLPREFYEALQYCKRNRTPFLGGVVRAFKAIGDPLVIVASSENTSKFTYSDAIFLDLKSFSSRNEIVKTLFPKRTEVCSHQPTIDEAESSSIEVQPVQSSETDLSISQDTGNGNLEMKRGLLREMSESSNIEVPLDQSSETDLSISQDTGNKNIEIKWGLIREMSDALELLKNDNNGNSKSVVLRKKVEVCEHIKILKNGVAQLIEQMCLSGEDIDPLCNAISINEEFDAFSSLLDTSDFGYKALSKIRQVLKSLEARRPQLDALLRQLDPDVDVGGSEENGDEGISDDGSGTNDRKDEDSSAVVGNECNPGAECGRKNGKNKKKKKKNNMKAKKGKGGKRKTK